MLELCRIIAGPIMGRILAEYGADVLKITSPHLSDVPFFQVDGNMGKHAASLDLKTAEGREAFEKLALEADVVLDGYRPGALEKLGFGPSYMTALAQRRGYGIVYVNENCFGYDGEWASRPGWQQIADCVCVPDISPLCFFLIFFFRLLSSFFLASLHFCLPICSQLCSVTNGYAGYRRRLGTRPIYGTQ